MTLTKTRLTGGVWEGVLKGAGAQTPTLQVTLQGDPVTGLTLEHDGDADAWHVKLPIPATLISDGVQTFVIRDAQGQVLASIALLAGDALAEDIRAELDLLRAEVDMLKTAFRRHCNDT